MTERTALVAPRSLHPEETFHRLIQGESARSERSGHSCRVLLIYRIDTQETLAPMDADVVTKTVSLLSSSLRATDSIGWYRDGYILGGLLVALQPDTAVRGYDNLTTRLMDGLRGALPAADDRAVRIGVMEPSERTALERLLGVKRLVRGSFKFHVPSSKFPNT
jgi:hypothetical protein